MKMNLKISDDKVVINHGEDTVEINLCDGGSNIKLIPMPAVALRPQHKEEESHECHCHHDGNIKPVYVVTDDEDKPIGVRVRTFDEDFTLALHDLGEEGKEYKWQDAMDTLKEQGLTTFNKKQALIIAAYKDEIDAALKEAGGEPLKGKWFWSVSESSSGHAWAYYGNYGNVNAGAKPLSYSVRPLLAH
jgi:hypothetical protein